MKLTGTGETSREFRQDVLMWLLAAGVFVYTFLRAERLPIIHDEAFSYLVARICSVKQIFAYNIVNANNHLLNTLLIKAFVAMFGGVTELIVRLPALLGHLLYLWGVYKIVHFVFKGWYRIAAFVLMISNPFLLQYFSLARGYALALGFTMAGFYYFILYIHEYDQQTNFRHLRALAGMLCLSVFSCLTFLQVFLAAFAAIAGGALGKHWKDVSFPQKIKAFLQEIAWFIGAGMVLLAVYWNPVRRLMAGGAFYFGGTTGFWADTVRSLIVSSLYGKNYGIPNLVFGSEIFVFVGLATGAGLLMYRLRSRQERSGAFYYLAGTFFLMAVSALATIVQHHMLGTKYLIERTAIFFIPFFYLYLFLTTVIAGKNKIVGSLLAAVFVSAAVIHFSQTAGISRCPSSYDQYTPGIMRDLAKFLKKKPFPANSVTMGTHWQLSHGVNFYIDSYDIREMKHVLQEIDKEYHLYLLCDNRALMSEETVKTTAAIMKKYHLKKLKEYGTAGLFFAVPSP